MKVMLMSLFFIVPHLLMADSVPVPTDKAAHYGLAFASQTICSAGMNKVTKKRFMSVAGCFIALNTLGIAKELSDPMRGGKKESGDVIANVLGTASAGVIFQWGF